MASNMDTGYDEWREDIESVTEAVQRQRDAGVSTADAYKSLDRDRVESNDESSMDDLDDAPATDAEPSSSSVPAPTTSTPSTSAPVRKARSEGSGGQTWDAKEELECWDRYWNVDGSAKSNRVGVKQRELDFNAWRRSNGYQGGDRSWNSMEQHINDLKKKQHVTHAQVKAKADLQVAAEAAGDADEDDAMDTGA